MNKFGIHRPMWDCFVDDSISQVGVVSKWEASEVYAGPWHAHLGIEALLCIHGDGIFRYGNQRIPYASGSILLFDGSVPHQVSMESNYKRWNICIWPERLYIDGSGTENDKSNMLLVPGSRTVYHMHTSGRDFYRLNHLFENIHQEFADGRPAYRSLIRLYYAELMVWLQRHHSEFDVKSARSSEPLSPGLVSEILNYIDNNLNVNISVNSIAEMFHYSTSHLRRLMMQSVGQTPSEYIKSRRVAKAQDLLLRTNLAVSHVAHAVGLSTGANLARLFRQEIGVSPSQYRDHFEKVGKSTTARSRSEVIWRQAYTGNA